MSYFRAINLLDEAGVPYGVKHIGNKPRVSAMPYTYDIAEGNIPDHSAIYKFGANEDVGTSYETIWTESGLYNWAAVDAAAGIVKVSSTSNNDNVGTSGVRTCTIYGLSLAGAEQNESIILTGQTAVNSTLSYSRVNRIICNTSGTGLVNAGKIYVGTGTVSSGVPAVKWAVVAVGENQTLQCLWTVPTGKTLYMTSFTFSTNSNKGNICKMYFRPPGQLFQIKTLVALFSTNMNHIFEFPLALASGTDIDMRAKGTATGAGIAATFEGWIE